MQWAWKLLSMSSDCEILLTNFKSQQLRCSHLNNKTLVYSGITSQGIGVHKRHAPSMTTTCVGHHTDVIRRTFTFQLVMWRTKWTNVFWRALLVECKESAFISLHCHFCSDLVTMFDRDLTCHSKQRSRAVSLSLSRFPLKYWGVSTSATGNENPQEPPEFHHIAVM